MTGDANRTGIPDQVMPAMDAKVFSLSELESQVRVQS